MITRSAAGWARRAFAVQGGRDREQEDKILEEMKNRGNEEEAKSFPGLFYSIAGGLVGLMVYFQYMLKTPQQTVSKPIVHVMGEAQIGGPWSALDSSGHAVSDTDFLGKFVVYYFGFTRCPDVCPASLQKLGKAIEILKVQKVRNVEFLFVSLDPEKDSPKKVGEYAAVFHSEIKGVLVPENVLSEFLKTFKLYARKVYAEGEYMIDHTTYMYLFDTHGKFLNVLGANLSHDELAEKISEHIKQLN